jgi:hypothetical protein
MIRRELEHALIKSRKPAAFLAGTAAGNERNERTVRQDLADRDGLKVEAALFLLRRAFKTELIQYRTYFKLRAVIELCYPQSREITNACGLALPGGFFMAADLEREIMAAVEEALPRLRATRRDTVAKAVQRVLEAARKQARKAGVPAAYAEYLREHMVPPTLAERRARALAYSQARDQLGDDAINIVIEDENTFYYQSFLDD